MTDAELAELLARAGTIAIPYFDGELIQVHHVDVPIDQALPVFKRFLMLSAENRRSDARHLRAYCMNMADTAGDIVFEDMGGVLPSEKEIWNHAHIKFVFIGRGVRGSGEAENKIFVQAELAVAWEHEHGMQMSWEDGRRLVKVGPFDGSPTNYYGPGKKPDHDYVYHSYFPSLCTLPDDV